MMKDILEICNGKWIKTVAEFEHQLLTSLLPHKMDITEARDFLKTENIHVVVFPDGKQELHGFGMKLGDIFCGIESHNEKGFHLVARFTPANNYVAKWN